MGVAVDPLRELPTGGLLHSALPGGAVGVEQFVDLDLPPVPGEEAAVDSATPGRSSEFRTGRWCARQALVGLGEAPVALPTDGAGAPTWPAGVVGSITHCAGYRAAAVGHRQAFGSIGIDAEPARPLPPRVHAAVLRPEELTRPDWWPTDPGADFWDRLVFSAKEAFYKAWHPLTGRWLEFHDARVDLQPDGRFTTTVLSGADDLVDTVAAAATWRGRWAVATGLCVTAVVAPATVSPRRP